MTCEDEVEDEELAALAFIVALEDVLAVTFESVAFGPVPLL